MLELVLGEPLALVRAGLRSLIEAQGHARIVGEAGDGQQLLELAAKRRPDAVFTEIDLPVMSGLEALSQIRRHYPDVAVMILSSATDGQHVRTALKCGAAGFLSKDAEPVELQLALRALEKRQTYLSPSISHYALDRRNSPRSEDRATVTPRQRQVLQMIARGRSTKEIAELMGVSVKTVETHRARLMQSLGLSGTNALMRYAIRLGLDTVQL